MFIPCKRLAVFACAALVLLAGSRASAGGTRTITGPIFRNLSVALPSAAVQPAGAPQETIVACKVVTPKTKMVLNPPPAQKVAIPPSFPSAGYVFYFTIGIGNWCYSLPQPLYTTVPGTYVASQSMVRFEHGTNQLVLKAHQSYVFATYAVPANPASKLYVIDHGTSNVSVFPSGANGNVAPIYQITNVGGFGGAPQGLAEDSRGFIYVTTIGADGVTTSLLVYAPGARGNAKPVRIITGPDTTLTNNSSDTGVGPDGSVYVNNGNGVAVFAPNADGDAKPVRLITGLNGGGAAVSPVTNFLYTVTAVGSSNNKIDAFGPLANGPAAPLYSLRGANAGVSGNLVGTDALGNVYECGTNTVMEFAPYQQGNVFPIRNLMVAHSVGLQPIAVDGAANVFVGDEDGARIYVFAPDADGHAPPVATIAGSNTGFINPAAIAVGR